jgi:methyl-accepting chemotaxis protein
MKNTDLEERRKNYFIKREFQTKFILKFCILIILTALISGFLIYLFSSQSVTTVFENSRLIIKPSTEFIIPGLILSSIISVIIVGIATIVVVLFISHRIAGPLYKLESSLERMASGDVSFDIYFRQTDETKRLAEIFNITSQGLNNLLNDVKKDLGKLELVVKEIRKMEDKPSIEPRDLKKAVDKLENTYAGLNEKFNKFRLRLD